MLPYLRPDGKAQVTVRYEVDERARPAARRRSSGSSSRRSTRDGLDVETLIRPDIVEHVLRPILPA